MPSVRVTSVDEAAKTHPREFAILVQLAPGDGSFDVPSDAWIESAKDLSGDASQATNLAASDEVDFDTFASAFKKPAQDGEGEGNCLGWAARDTSGVLSPLKVVRRDVRELDVKVKITHAGICHSDLHSIKNEWTNAIYPLIPGHEIVGIVVEVGSGVTKFKVGDRAGVGTFVDSCLDCQYCNKGLQQHCRKGVVGTYNAKGYDGEMTYGGYSTSVVVDERFVLKLPDSLPLRAASPLLCAGITVYSPLKHYGLDKPGMRIGVVGLGGLGHMAVKFAAAFGCQVTVISRSNAKEAEAKAMGAHHLLVSAEEEAMKAAAGTFDGIVDTVSSEHDLQAIANLLDVEGKLVLVGVPPIPQLPVSQATVVFKRLTIGGSLVGGIEETQEMLDLCGEKNILPEVEVIPMSYVNTAMERVLKGDVKFRFVIDVQASLID